MFFHTTHNLMQRFFYLYNSCGLLQLQMEIEMFTKSQDSSATEFSNALVVKGHLKLVDQIVRSFFSYGNSGFSIKILTDVCFAFKKNKFSIAVHYHLSLIG